MPAPRRWILFSLLLVVLTAAALAFVFNFVPAPFQAPRVVATEPANDAADILPTSPITITFSAPMNRDETQNAISFTPRVTGDFAWRDDQTLVFTPRARLPISTTVTLTLSQDARSWLLRPLQNETRARFTTLARPYVVSSTPAREAKFVYVPNQVRIEFNRAMDEHVLREKLRVEPPLENFSILAENSAVVVNGWFEPRTQYTITLPASAVDAQYGIELNRASVWSFTAARQYPNISILNRGRVMEFSANAPIAIPTQFTNISRLDAALYAISPQEFAEYADAPFEQWYAFQPPNAPLKTWRAATDARLDQYTQFSLELGALTRGTYYLRITTPEGVGDAQLLHIL